jgi:hypothetical protein
MKDPALSICSAGARGVWMDVMCLMFESPQRGYLITNGKPWTLEQIAVALRGDWQENLVYLKELVHNGVMKQVGPQKPSRKCPRNMGAFFSKRLVSDEGQRTAWRGQKRRQRVEKKRNSVHPLSALSSSSSSSSPSKINTTPPTPPLPRGEKYPSHGTTETVFQWSREYVAVKMGNRKRLFSDREKEALAGARADRVVEFLRGRGFESRVVSEEEVESWNQTAKAAAV